MVWQEQLSEIVRKHRPTEYRRKTGDGFWTWLRKVGYYNTAKACAERPNAANCRILNGYWNEYLLDTME